jgi:hypothetical protein
MRTERVAHPVSNVSGLRPFIKSVLLKATPTCTKLLIISGERVGSALRGIG